MTSKQQSEKMISKYGEGAMKEAQSRIKKAKTAKSEVFWRSVAYHIKTNKKDKI